jgi:hypothetical protein
MPPTRTAALALLGLAEELGRRVTPQQLKTAYRAQALKWHPDKNRGDPKAGERFKLINEAFQMISTETTGDGNSLEDAAAAAAAAACSGFEWTEPRAAHSDWTSADHGKRDTIVAVWPLRPE